MKYFILRKPSGDVFKLETPTRGTPYIPIFESEEDAIATKEWLEQECGQPELKVDTIECDIDG